MKAKLALAATILSAATVLVVSPATAATAPSAVFSTDSNWGSGYQAKYTISAGTSALTSWKLEFDLPAGSTLGSYWDALDTPSGAHHSFANREYNGSVAAGASTSFGFLVSGGGLPANCKLNGQPCAGTTIPTTPPTTTPPTTTTPPPTGGSARVSPYIDITMATPSLVSVANATGQKNFTLAFALGSSLGCDPQWGGTVPLLDARIINDVTALRGLGGGVTVASGGALGPYLENVCGSVDALYNAYVKTLDAVGSNSLDVDVEASIPTATVNQALLRLQQQRGTHISYTMRIQGQDYGMDPFSVQILQDAASRGLNVVVNPMLMDFGYSGSWGDALISAANATLGQLKTIWPAKSDAELKGLLGLTPMIGRNDTGSITDQTAARRLLSYAQVNHVASIGFWSAGRDNGGCPGGGAVATCSGISQSLYEFTNIFKAYTG
ncbi:cellulose binding domain-containing protein [Amycolatopsis sp. FBCC-B4732]|uniref:cellulose binding domain-containing protein n=1 Tax=Amycolatopsis sp. FBCC-B4732 TaxID=3079339 RepID=UPI001FF37281|nr:cellulose binding domain-containing protein [Amycolatopsis sp. FBCC-B4732]UOX86929.1 cellulose binding domain-containing protein [Amycolatopsis sp. FBCC-B4732]